jgi:hypothetical protein
VIKHGLGAVIALLLLVQPVAAQTCTPQRLNLLYNGEAGCGQIPCTLATMAYQYVPGDEFWVISDANVDQVVWPGSGPIKYDLMNIYVSSLDPHHWTYGMAAIQYSLRSLFSQTAATTPVLSWTASGKGYVMMPFERLGVRTAGIPAGGILALTAAGWRFPLSCLGRWLGMEAGVVGTATNTPPPVPPDFTALVNAAQSAATALTTLAQSAP